MTTQKNPIQSRFLKRGETLLKAGGRLTHLYIIQSGEIGIYQEKNGKMVQLYRMSSPQSIGEDAVFGPASWSFHALALQSTEVLEIPIELVKKQLQTTHAFIQPLIKGLYDRTKFIANEIKTIKNNRDLVPCPGTHTAKVFGVIFHVARSLGVQSGSVNQVDWDEFKKFALEVFNEPSARLEEAVYILIKLSYVDLSYPPEKPNGLISFKDMTQIEAFFDFYQNYYFKSGYSELLKTNEKATKVTQSFLHVADEYPADRAGNVQMPYKATIEAMKKVLGNSFEADQLFRLEQKGLFMKRTATNDGGFLSFYRPDFEQMLLNWKLLKEVECWNELGYVQIDEVLRTPSGHSPQPQENNSHSDQEPGHALQEAKKLWAKRLENWKPKTQEGQIPQIRTGSPQSGEVWCPVCLSELKQRAMSCEICGYELSQKAS